MGTLILKSLVVTLSFSIKRNLAFLFQCINIRINIIYFMYEIV